jgi:hypothetical protein
MNAWERASIGVTIVVTLGVGVLVFRQPSPRAIADAQNAAQRASDSAEALAKTPCPTLYRLSSDKKDSLFVAITRPDCKLP